MCDNYVVCIAQPAERNNIGSKVALFLCSIIFTCLLLIIIHALPISISISARLNNSARSTQCWEKYVLENCMLHIRDFVLIVLYRSQFYAFCVKYILYGEACLVTEACYIV